MVRVRNWFVALVATLFLSACASMPTPETPAQKLAYAEAQFYAAVESASDLRASGIMGDETARRVDEIAQRGNRALNLAYMALDENKPETSLEYLQTVNRLLLELRQKIQEVQEEENGDG